MSDGDDLAAGCLSMVRDFLAAQPCRHGPAGGGHGHTPAMMYPEWIACVIARAVGDERERCARECERLKGQVADFADSHSGRGAASMADTIARVIRGNA